MPLVSWKFIKIATGHQRSEEIAILDLLQGAEVFEVMKCHQEIKEREDEMAQGGKAPRRLACGIWAESVTLGDITEFETD
jgi:hypothetical protein